MRSSCERGMVQIPATSTAKRSRIAASSALAGNARRMAVEEVVLKQSLEFIVVIVPMAPDPRGRLVT